MTHHTTMHFVWSLLCISFARCLSRIYLTVDPPFFMFSRSSELKRAGLFSDPEIVAA